MRRVNKGERARLRLTLNGRKMSGEAEPRMLLCDFLRHELQAYGVHVGCEHGVCGACTVMVDGRGVALPSGLAHLHGRKDGGSDQRRHDGPCGRHARAVSPQEFPCAVPE